MMWVVESSLMERSYGSALENIKLREKDPFPTDVAKPDTTTPVVQPVSSTKRTSVVAAYLKFVNLSLISMRQVK